MSTLFEQWRCLSCGAAAPGPRPRFCPRCQAVSSFVRIALSPAQGPPRKRPVRASDLPGVRYAPALGEPWDSSLGRLGRPLRILLWGEPGQGKTTRVLQLGDCFAQHWGPTLLDEVDEGTESPSFRDRIKRLEVSRLFVVSSSWSELAEELRAGNWKVVILDSANRLGVVPGELDDYTRSLGISWVVLLEATKAETFKGDASWAHWADIVARVEGMKLHLQKNRFARINEKVGV